VRRALVGLELPLAAGQPQPVTQDGLGVVSREVEALTTAYVVDGRAAVAVLEAAASGAAAWWRANAPHVLRSDGQFLFPVEVCQPLQDDQAQA
jgi:hypothetical protein